jgi:hypothetical protein
MKGQGQDLYKKFDDELRRQIKFLDYAPVLHISAATGERTTKLLEMIDKVADARVRRSAAVETDLSAVPTREFERTSESLPLNTREAIRKTRPRASGASFLRIPPTQGEG